MDRARYPQLLETMLLARRFDERLFQIFDRGLFPGHFHVSIGQEAIAAAVMDYLGAADVVFTNFRSHGHLIARGLEPGRLFAEILGKSGGCCAGKGGTLHLADRALGVPVTSAMVGGGIPHATGAALALSRSQIGSIATCFFGDGAIEEGAFYEAINIAALWQLPVLYVCENNGGRTGQKAGEGSWTSPMNAADSYVDLVRAAGVHASAVDGSHLSAIHDHLKEQVQAIRGGGGPRFVEMRTSQWPGSRTLWPALIGGPMQLGWVTGEKAPPVELVEWYARHDPIALAFAESRATGVLDPGQLAEIDERVTGRVDAAADEAIGSPVPEPAAAWDHVFAAYDSSPNNQ